jgi:uncharacterized protein
MEGNLAPPVAPQPGAIVPSAAGRSRPIPIEHGIVRSIALHLGPGVAMLGFYLLVAPVVMRWGFPPILASLLTIPIIQLPWVVGYLGHASFRATGRVDVAAVIDYRTSLRAREYVGYSVALIVWGALVFQAYVAAGGPEFAGRAFAWLPEWFLNPQDFGEIVALDPARLAILIGSLLVFAGVVAPVIEEIYYRGHLLPGVSRLGFWAPLLTTALFTTAHLESPWENPARFFMVLPLVYLVWWKRSLRLGIFVHVALNTISALVLTAAVLSAR